MLNHIKNEMVKSANHSKTKTIFLTGLNIVIFFLAFSPLSAQTALSPVNKLKQNEKRHSNFKGETHLGIVMTVVYPAYDIVADERYYDTLAALAGALKKPDRKNYRIVLRGFTDTSGRSWDNFHISLKRAEALKDLFVEHPKMSLDPIRIQFEGFGETNPVASNNTPAGRAQNRRVEIHVYGEVEDNDHND
jgi:outer membrane protein OmpA-like peptidoglycan-associated protein